MYEYQMKLICASHVHFHFEIRLNELPLPLISNTFYAYI
jgi:hypothetical protein